MTEKNTFKKGVLVGALSVLFIGILLVLGYIGWNLIGGGESFFYKFKTIETILKSRYLYYGEVEETELEDGMLSGYVQALNEPYTVYYNEEETKRLFESTEGTFGGIGVGISQDPESMEIRFLEVYEGSPGEKAGFLEGDVISKVNGTSVEGMELDDVISLIRGEAGTSVEITVIRQETEEYTASVTRELVESVVVTSEWLGEGIGYIQVTQFEKVAAEQFEEALDSLQQKGMEALIIDLRNNPGGDLDTVCEMADLVLPEGVIVSTKDRNGKGETYRSDEERQLDLPIVVLVNENSASASEVFAGAMKDHQAATLVGSTTFGKGIVQEIYQLSDGTSLKLTSSEYFTPNGYNIHGIGIEPDVAVEEGDQEEDLPLKKAIEILKNGM